MSLATSMSPSPPPDEVEEGDTSIRISIRIYGGTGAAVILLALIIVAVLACVLQQRRNKKVVDKEETNGYSHVYLAAGTGQYSLHVYTYTNLCGPYNIEYSSNKYEGSGCTVQKAKQ